MGSLKEEIEVEKKKWVELSDHWKAGRQREADLKKAKTVEEKMKIQRKKYLKKGK